MSPDSTESHRKFIDNHSLPFGLLADRDKSVMTAYGAWGEKNMYGRKYMGIERATFLIGPEGTVANVWRKVKVPGHVEAVLEAATALSGQ